MGVEGRLFCGSWGKTCKENQLWPRSVLALFHTHWSTRAFTTSFYSSIRTIWKCTLYSYITCRDKIVVRFRGHVWTNVQSQCMVIGASSDRIWESYDTSGHNWRVKLCVQTKLASHRICVDKIGQSQDMAGQNWPVIGAQLSDKMHFSWTARR